MTLADTLRRIETYCEQQYVEETTFGRKAVNDGKLVARLRSGKTITVDTLALIEVQLTLPKAESAWDQRARAA